MTRMIHGEDDEPKFRLVIWKILFAKVQNLITSRYTIGREILSLQKTLRAGI